MRNLKVIENKLLTTAEACRRVNQWKILGKTVAFTNGCFDILHQGHIFSLTAAAAEADYLIVGVNADQSVKRLKGAGRPVNAEQSRAVLLASLLMVDAVVIFEEDTPRELIRKLLPDVLVKGGDYKVDEIAGAQDVLDQGGRVVINPLLEGYSTTGIILQLGKK